jgi:uncharacterized protein YlxW (UPF0749 family)
MKQNNESAKSTKTAKPLSAMQQKAALAAKVAALTAQMAELEKAKAELNDAENEVREAARVELEAVLNTLPKLTGLVDLATVGRCCIALAKNGHLKAEKSGTVGDGERKARVVLTDEQSKAVVDELRTMQAAKPGICGHCRTIEARTGMPGFQTLYMLAKENGIGNTVEVSKK